MDNVKDSGNKIYSVFVPVVFIALILDIFSLNETIDMWRPSFCTLILIFFASFDPFKIKIEIVFIVGIILDLLVASPLGSFAFIFATQIFIIVSQFKRFYLYAIYQQAIIIGISTFITYTIAYWLLHLIGVPNYEIAFVQRAISTTICWPFIFLLMSFLCKFFAVYSPFSNENK